MSTEEPKLPEFTESFKIKEPSAIANPIFTFVLRIHLRLPAPNDVIEYFHNTANLAHETQRNLESQMNWKHRSTFASPEISVSSLQRLLETLPNVMNNEVQGKATILKVEIFNPFSHQLIGSSDKPNEITKIDF